MDPDASFSDYLERKVIRNDLVVEWRRFLAVVVYERRLWDGVSQENPILVEKYHPRYAKPSDRDESIDQDDETYRAYNATKQEACYLAWLILDRSPEAAGSGEIIERAEQYIDEHYRTQPDKTRRRMSQSVRRHELIMSEATKLLMNRQFPPPA